MAASEAVSHWNSGVVFEQQLISDMCPLKENLEGEVGGSPRFCQTVLITRGYRIGFLQGSPYELRIATKPVRALPALKPEAIGLGEHRTLERPDF